jgi:hypothetical protein
MDIFVEIQLFLLILLRIRDVARFIPSSIVYSVVVPSKCSLSFSASARVW